jgi:hypothetical protein
MPPPPAPIGLGPLAGRPPPPTTAPGPLPNSRRVAPPHRPVPHLRAPFKIGTARRRPVFLFPPPFSPLLMQDRAPHPPCFLSTPTAGAAATPPGNRSHRRCRHFNPLTMSSNLQPSSSYANGPSSLLIRPSCYRTHRSSSSTTGARRRRETPSSRRTVAPPDQ